MFEVDVLTQWVTDERGDNLIGVALDYPTPHGWTDITGQPDANIMPDPNLFVVRGRISEAQLDELEADARYVVLNSEAIL